MLNFQLLAHLAKGIADNVQLMTELIHHAGNAFRVFQDLHALSIRIVLHTKWTLNGFCKLPIQVKKDRELQTKHKCILCMQSGSIITFLNYLLSYK